MFLTTSNLDDIGDLEDIPVPFTIDLPTHGIQNSELPKEENWREGDHPHGWKLPHTCEVTDQ